MIGVSGLLFISCLHLHASLINAACEAWIEVAADDITDKYVAPSSAAASTSFPVGFKALTAQYMQAKPPCVKFRNANGDGRHYEFLYEVDPPTYSLCIRNQITNQEDCSTAGTSTGSQCNQIPSPDVAFEFRCGGCEAGGQINFWYKYQLEAAVNTSYDEYWCDNRPPRVYPSSLKVTSSGGIPIPTPPSDNSPGGAQGRFNLFSIISLFFLCQLFYIVANKC